MLREPVVAGMFYEKDAHSLKIQVNKYIDHDMRKTQVKGIMVPHAGYIYSGETAGSVYSRIIIPETMIILGPNHTGFGAPVSVMNEGAWRTPLGDVRINEPMADDIIKKCAYAEADTEAHLNEHSIEVQLPFIQELSKSAAIVPVVLGTSDINVLKDLARVLGDAVKGRNAVIAASTDLTHYESAAAASKKDKKILDAINNMDEEKLAKEVKENDISMCGWMPVYVMLAACKNAGASEAQIIKYSNSGEINGKTDSVVGYAGAVVL
ncbi:MAG: AmmeMemoRadiSam system protein B [Candidatus Goldiibacteriota bacterium]